MQFNPQQQIQQRYNAALQLHRAGRLDDAAKAYSALLKQFPKIAEAHYQLARIAAARGRADERLSAISAALALKPAEPAILNEAIAANADAGQQDIVLDCYDRLIALDEKAVKPQADKALYLQRIGRFDASEKLFRKLLKKHPNDAELYRMFSATVTFTQGDPLIGAMRRLSRSPRLTNAGQMHVGFALAKALEDVKAYHKVFAQLRKANAAQQAEFPYDSQARQREWDAVLKAQERLPDTSPDQSGPPRFVFVTGLPRSGTTLVEQIIASHSDAVAGGEIGVALKAAYQQFGAGEAMRPPDEATVAEQEAFLARLSKVASGLTKGTAGTVTDKSIMNFLIYGVLHRLLPNARFIIVHRDPRDIAVSIFKNHFAAGSHRYANDLADIAQVIKDFRRFVRHWREALPDRFFEVRYEDLVADPKTWSRRLLEHAGLPWEDQCLDFHKAKGTVKTLSLHQVRQPIYASSSQAWRRYEADLQPFFEAWGDDPWD